MANTDATAEATEVTENSGESGNQAGSENQGSDLAAKLAELETKLQNYVSLESKVKDLEEEKKRAAAEALRWQSTYKGLQRQTTQKLQEAAQVQRQLMEAQHSSTQLAELRETVNLLATKMLDEDQAKDFALAQRELRIKQMEEAMKRQPQIVSQQQPDPGFAEDPDVIKRQYLDYYFPGVALDHNHPEIDWGEGAPNQQEALRRFTSSVSKLVGKAQTQPQAPVKSEAEQLLEQLRKERSELESSRTSAIEEAKAQARRETEDRLRKLGIDAGSTPAAPESQRRVSTDLNELDETLLTRGDPLSTERKKARQQYEQQLANVRKRLLSQMQ